MYVPSLFTKVKVAADPCDHLESRLRISAAAPGGQLGKTFFICFIRTFMFFGVVAKNFPFSQLFITLLACYAFTFYISCIK